jgi:hypothetical protein
MKNICNSAESISHGQSKVESRQYKSLNTLMMEAARTSETLVKFYQTTQCNNPEDSHLNTSYCSQG